MRKKLYDKDNKRLVFIDRAASTEFWDEQWEATAAETFMGFKSRQYINMISPRLGTILSLVLDKLLGKYIGHAVLLVLRKN
tara:strand:- start:176 stop:418 length:243 start_codon:yes stop_codon:yes gene_type:complete